MFSKNNKKVKNIFLKKCGLKTNPKYSIVSPNISLTHRIKLQNMGFDSQKINEKSYLEGVSSRDTFRFLNFLKCVSSKNTFNMTFQQFGTRDTFSFSIF